MLINNEMDQLHSTAMEFVLSDDIWNKFELPVFDGILSNPFSELDEDYTITSLFGLDNLEIRNHDCMWAGHCGSKEHPVDEVKPIKPLIPIPAPVQPAKQMPAAAIAPGRSLLIKTQNQQQTTIPASLTTTTTTPMMPGLDSPPNSDDEDVKVKTETLKLLQDAISECDLKDDSDLYDYWDDDELLEVDDEEAPAPEEQQQQQRQPQVPQQKATSNATIVISDHCYHKDKNASMRINNLGLETPSDSEEEIDVVSVGDKQTSTRMVCTLPNNPTSRDKQQLQRTMASAITKNGIKTFPTRKPSTVDHSPVKRPVHDSRGLKRPKHHRSPPISPYKKRTYNHSSDSEPEPSEKRSMHNNMERQRRIGLRNAFEDLRGLVPEVSKRDRAPKVVILREAAVYCHRLGDVSEGMLRQIEDLRRQQKRLRARVSQLRLSLAAKHR